MIQEINAKDRSIAFVLFGFLFACYLVTYTGVIQSSDGLAMFATTESIVRRGEVDMNQLLWMDRQQGSYGDDGDLYSRKGVGTTLLALPLVWLARWWPALGLVHAALLLNPLLTAWTGALIYRAGCRLEWRRSVAMATALLFGLATMAWPYTQTFFSEPLVGWGMFGALYGLLTFRQTGRKRYLMAGGMAWGLAYLARTLNLLTLPIYLVGLVVVMMRQARAWSREGRYPVVGVLLVRNWRPLASFLIPIALAGLASLWWNWVRYGSLWATGYAETERFVSEVALWFSGTVGLLVGPARGLMWYNPALLLAIPGGFWFWRNKPWIFGITLANVLLYIMIYGGWYMWHGGFSWGPRFLVPLVPLLAFLTGPVLAWLTTGASERGSGKLWQGIVGMLVALSIGVQWLGMVIPFGLVQDWLAATVQPLFAPETFTQLQYSPLVLQWRFLHTENLLFAWWRLQNGVGSIDWIGLAIVLTGAVMAALLVARQWQRADADTEADLPLSWLYGLTLLILVIGLLIRYQVTLDEGGMGQVAQVIEQQEKPGDAILHLLPQETQQFANVYHGVLPVYGFAPTGELNATQADWLARLRIDQDRLWVIPGYATPDTSAWERRLRVDEYLLLDERPAAVDGQRVALYAFGAGHPLAETGLGAIFGYQDADEVPVTAESGWATLRGYALTPEAAPGDAILLALHWQVLRPVTYDYHVFVHLLTATGERLTQRDGQPVQWLRPTSSWQPGEEIADHYAMLLPEDAAAGLYTIAIGLYDPVSGVRLPVSAGAGDYALQLGPIEVHEKR